MEHTPKRLHPTPYIPLCQHKSLAGRSLERITPASLFPLAWRPEETVYYTNSTIQLVPGE